MPQRSERIAKPWSAAIEKRALHTSKHPGNSPGEFPGCFDVCSARLSIAALHGFAILSERSAPCPIEKVWVFLRMLESLIGRLEIQSFSQWLLAEIVVGLSHATFHQLHLIPAIAGCQRGGARTPGSLPVRRAASSGSLPRETGKVAAMKHPPDARVSVHNCTSQASPDVARPWGIYVAHSGDCMGKASGQEGRSIANCKRS